MSLVGDWGSILSQSCKDWRDMIERSEFGGLDDTDSYRRLMFFQILPQTPIPEHELRNIISEFRKLDSSTMAPKSESEHSPSP